MARKPASISKENKAIAKSVASAFGGVPHVDEFAHETEELTVGVLWSKDRPCKGVMSYSTVRLSDYPMYQGRREFPARIELAGACALKRTKFPNILAAAAFCIMRTGKLVCHGSLMRDYVREYYPRTTVPHLYFTAPFLWETELKILDCGTKKVSWLLIVPISDAEAAFLGTRGDNALETLFEKQQIDIYDLARDSVT